MANSFITLRSMVSEISDDKLRKLVLYFLDKPELEHLACSPYHHDYDGGLVDHILEVTQLSIGIYNSCGIKDKLSYDFLVTGAMIHDVGKLSVNLEEYRNCGTAHATVGAHVVSEACKLFDISDDTRRLFMSLIVEHSKFGLGECVKFSTRESYIVYTADCLSSAICAETNTSMEAAMLWDTIREVKI